MYFSYLCDLDNPKNNPTKTQAYGSEPIYNDFYSVIYLWETRNSEYREYQVKDDHIFEECSLGKIYKKLASFERKGIIYKSYSLFIRYAIIKYHDEYFCLYIEKTYLWENIFSNTSLVLVLSKNFIFLLIYVLGITELVEKGTITCA